jgi:hypothetical protein
MRSGKGLDDIPYFAGLFSLVSCLSKPWEISTTVCIGRKTFRIS